MVPAGSRMCSRLCHDVATSKVPFTPSRSSWTSSPASRASAGLSSVPTTSHPRSFAVSSQLPSPQPTSSMRRPPGSPTRGEDEACAAPPAVARGEAVATAVVGLAVIAAEIVGLRQRVAEAALRARGDLEAIARLRVDDGVELRVQLAAADVAARFGCSRHRDVRVQRRDALKQHRQVGRRQPGARTARRSPRAPRTASR